MKLKIFISALLLSFAATSFSQQYEAAIGLRGGSGIGITYKQFLSENMALEGILIARFRGFQLAGLAEFHQGAFDTPGLEWYYGGGAHLGFYSYKSYSPFNSFPTTTSNIIIGIDGILGLEYTLSDYPVCFSVDFNPQFNAVGYSGLALTSGAASIRYIFK